MQQLTNVINSSNNNYLPVDINNHRRPNGSAWPSLHVGNLPTIGFYDLDFYQFFTNKGYKLRGACVASDFNKTKSLGYGYLNFYDEQEQ
jgi:hypothetical protein